MGVTEARTLTLDDLEKVVSMLRRDGKHRVYVTCCQSGSGRYSHTVRGARYEDGAFVLLAGYDQRLDLEPDYDDWSDDEDE